jgi:hypothetical protein
VATTQRTDVNTISYLITKLHDDFQVALDTDSLNEWGAAMSALAAYMAERHREIHVADEA